jgi:N utilization substance protein B
MISRRLLRIKILQIVYAHFSSQDSSLSRSEKDLLFSIQKTYELYCYLLLLPVAVKDYAVSRMELAKTKNLPSIEDLNPNTRFTDNSFIAKLEQSTPLKEYLKKHKLSWSNYPELIRKLYQQLSETSYFINYMSQAECSPEDDRQLMLQFYTRELEDNGLLYDILEEQSIFWNDDIEFVLGVIIQGIRNQAPETAHTLLPLFKNEEDKDYAVTLLRHSITDYLSNRELIERFVTNWDVERIALTDILILNMAIAEIVHFPSIPVRVSFDEFLELSKFYSTSKSSVFINGILDKIVVHLQELNLVRKTGRGLMEGN